MALLVRFLIGGLISLGKALVDDSSLIGQSVSFSDNNFIIAVLLSITVAGISLIMLIEVDRKKKGKIDEAGNRINNDSS